jgi:hypothetical protein
MRGSIVEVLKQCGILNDDLTLHRCVERRLKNNPDIAMLITSATKFLLYSAPLKARIYCIVDGICHQPMCKVCGAILQMRLSGPHRYTFPEFCGAKCFARDPSVSEKRKTTNERRYGYTNVMMNPDTVTRRNNTWLEKYGVDNVLRLSEIQDRIRRTKRTTAG